MASNNINLDYLNDINHKLIDYNLDKINSNYGNVFVNKLNDNSNQSFVISMNDINRFEDNPQPEDTKNLNLNSCSSAESIFSPNFTTSVVKLKSNAELLMSDNSMITSVKQNNLSIVNQSIVHTDFKDETETIINNIGIEFEVKIDNDTNVVKRDVVMKTIKLIENKEEEYICKMDTIKQNIEESFVNFERDTSD